jgi:hypothetical protein
VLAAITWFKGTAFTWNYITEFYPLDFLILSTVPSVVIATPIALLTAWQTHKSF